MRRTVGSRDSVTWRNAVRRGIATHRGCRGVAPVDEGGRFRPARGRGLDKPSFRLLSRECPAHHGGPAGNTTGEIHGVTLDSLFTAQGRNPVLLGVLAGAGLALLAGIQFGRPLKYAAGGAIVGALVGFGLPKLMDDPSAVSTTLGSFPQERIDELIEERRVASTFLVQVRQKALPFNLGGDPFRLVYPNPVQDVVLGELLRAEADDIGMYIDDDAVNTYIDEATFNLLKQDDFKEVKKNTYLRGKRVSESQLYDILREQITATMALRTLVPFRDTDSMTPEMYWELFRKMRVRQSVAAIPIETNPTSSAVRVP